MKIHTLSAKKHLEADEKIVETASSLHMNFSLYAISNKGNLYFIYIDMKEQKITKVHKEFLGTYQTINEENKEIVVNRKPSSICAN